MPDPRRLSVLASVNAAFFSVFQITWVILFPYLAESLHLSVASVAASFAIGSFFFLFGAPLWSRRSGRIGHGKVLLIGISGLLVSVSAIMLLVALPNLGPLPTLAILVSSRIFYGLTASAMIPICQLLQIEAGPHAAIAMHRHALSINTGRMTALAFAFFTAQAASFAGPLGPTLVLALLITTAVAYPWSSSAIPAAGFIRTGWNFAGLPYRHALLFALLFTCLIETVGSMLADHLKGVFSLLGNEAATRTAELLLIAAVGTVVFQSLGRKFVLASPAAAFWIALLFLGAGTVGLMESTSLGTARLATLAIAVGTAWLPPLYLARIYLARIYRSTECDGSCSRGERAAHASVAHTLGFALGGGIAAIAVHFGPPAKTLGIVAIICAIFLTAVALERRPHEKFAPVTR